MSKTTAPEAPTTSSAFALSDTQTIDSNPEARAQLDQALQAFSTKPVFNGVVSGSVNTAPTAEVIDSEELTPTLDKAPEEESSSEEVDTEETETEEEPDLSAFDSEFAKRFGVKPEEAVETINSLLAFRDEMALMRGWGVSPTEYDSRMAQVKEFYLTLPEDKQPEFNSAEGAKAIWEHLEKTQTPSKKKASTVSKVGSSKRPATANKPKDFIKKSDILRMDNDTYQRRLPEINAAWREGRVLEDQ